MTRFHRHLGMLKRTSGRLVQVGVLLFAVQQDRRIAREIQTCTCQHVDRAGLGILDDLNRGIHNLRQIVRRNVGGHADRNAAGAVDEKIGNAGGQHGGLECGFVVVRREVDGLHFDIGKQLAGDAHHASLGVTHGCRWITID